MTGAARSELRKLLATRSLWLLPVGGAAVVLLAAAVFASQAAPADIGDRLSDYGPLRFGAGNIGRGFGWAKPSPFRSSRKTWATTSTRSG